jgi:Putative transposase of IS4/5 family (DUF4096)
MWTNENRARYDRNRLRYPSDLTDAEWAHVEPLIPPPKRGGNRRHVDEREIVNGLLYVLSTGCQWRAVGGEVEEGERLAVEAFPVLGQRSAATEPGEGTFDPALGQDEEVLGVIRPLDDLNRDLRERSSDGPLKLRSSIAAVGKEPGQKGKGAVSGREGRADRTSKRAWESDALPGS